MSDQKNSLIRLATTIQNSNNILLTTHRCCDGDGLGSLLGMYHGLKKINKTVRAVTVDAVSKKYKFLSPEKYTESFDNLKTPIEPTDLALIFDTNDERLIQPLFKELKQKCKNIIFVDHHPLLTKGPQPTAHLTDTSAASTGEISYSLLKQMNIPLDTHIATAIYTSILFDTQRFHFIKHSALSYKICAETYPYVEDNHIIYSYLFDIQSKEKMNMLSKAIHKIEYLYKDQVAVLELSHQEMFKYHLDMSDACDFIDIALGIVSVKLAVLIMSMPNNTYRLSFRSKNWDVSQLAEHFKGGGHKNSSGATLVNCTKSPKADILKVIKDYYPRLSE